MRRVASGWWPALSHWFGLHPWDIDRLTAAELQSYIEAVPNQKD